MDREERGNIREIQEAEEVTRGALDPLGSGRNDAYRTAVAALLEDARDWWAETLARQPAELDENEEAATADSEGLRSFIEGEVLPCFETRRRSVVNRPVICDLAYGERLTPTGWSGSAATRCILTVSWNGRFPCCSR